ncbi:alpha/beta hydrolase fold domain-containing protein [Amycolatopsis sp. RM579]|uniref:Alpha/beta hydrolase fold domain-containing protein n=2 Tax=Amycolatopsis pithecellobii TaxID=664692 RepID=A0A6N7Z161_9PSEU|nr:alpha/beta hydrolase fold domain-containing protein [Amycolatopsis pithecellobii]
MVSMPARLRIAALRASGQKRFYDSADALHRRLPRHQRASKRKPPRWLQRTSAVRRHDVDGFPCYTIGPRAGAGDLQVLHLHGGGFVEEIEPHHWRFAAELVRRLRCTVTLPIYPLVPRYSHTTILPMVQAAYERLLRETPPQRRILSGDSAGGALALAIAQKLRERGEPQPERIVLISPWLDVLLDDPMSVLLDDYDPMLGITGLREAGRMYAEGADPHDPRISPRYADLAGLGPFSLFIGARDVLLPDARRFARRATEAGIDIDYRERRGMFHNWVMEKIPEGREELNHLERILRRPPADR